MEQLDKIRIACLAIIVFLFAADTLDISLDFIPGIVKTIVFGLLIMFGVFFRTQQMGDVDISLFKTLKGKKEEETEKEPVFEFLNRKYKPRN